MSRLQQLPCGRKQSVPPVALDYDPATMFRWRGIVVRLLAARAPLAWSEIFRETAINAEALDRILSGPEFKLVGHRFALAGGAQ